MKDLKLNDDSKDGKTLLSLSKSPLSKSIIGAIGGTLLLTSNALAAGNESSTHILNEHEKQAELAPRDNDGYCNIPNPTADRMCDTGHQTVIDKNPHLAPKQTRLDGENAYDLGRFGIIPVRILQDFLDRNPSAMLTPAGLAMRLSDNVESLFPKGGSMKGYQSEFSKYLNGDSEQEQEQEEKEKEEEDSKIQFS